MGEVSAFRFRKLRGLRRRVDQLLPTHWDSVWTFSLPISADPENVRKIRGFRNLRSADGNGHVSLASTATCIRSLRFARARWRQVGTEALLAELNSRYAKEILTTTDLPHMNAFTVGQISSVIGDIGAKTDDLLYVSLSNEVKGWCNTSGIGLGDFPPHGYLSYWILSGCRSLKVHISSSSNLIRWAENELNRQLALLGSGDEEGDPYQLGYSLAILQAFNSNQLRPNAIVHALALLRDTQLDRGLWEKKEPLFVWGKGGDAYCFSFELLNTLLYEFRNSYSQLSIMDGAFSRALEWAERNAHEEGLEIEFRGWRSGHRTESKEPESWATAEVYSFLRRYHRYLSHRINSELLGKYRGSVPEPRPRMTAFDKIYQPEVRNKKDRNRRNEPLLGHVLKTALMEPLRVSKDPDEFSLIQQADARHCLRSGILYGPPRTGKSSFVRAVARYLGWPIVIVDPSDFAREGLALMPNTVRKVFDDLSEAQDTVIYFDEMEELISYRSDGRDSDGRDRSAAEKTFEQRLLTTVLLPNLQDLHDSAKTIFFISANHLSETDHSPGRLGRFDLSLEVLPPCYFQTVQQIVDGIVEGQICPESENGSPFAQDLEEYLLRADIKEEFANKLSWATYGEVRTLVDLLMRLQSRRGCCNISEVKTLLTEWRASIYSDLAQWDGGHTHIRIGSENEREFDTWSER